MSAEELARFLLAYVGFVPGLVITVIAGVALSGRVAGALGMRPILGFGLILGIGIALSATITPSQSALTGGVVGTGTCDMSRLALPSRNQLAWPGETPFNILLFLPLGVAIGLSPRSRTNLVVVLLAFALPVVIEVVQLIATTLGRECQSRDVIDNLIGLTLGIATVTSVRWIAQTRSTTPKSDRGIVAGVAVLGVVALAVLLLAPVPRVAPPITAAPTAAPSSTPAEPGASVRVTTIPALLDALADNAVTDIVVANGTYRVSPAGNGAANSLWIGERFAGRTNPVTVRAETRGEVTFDGGGTTYFGGLSFEEGAHHQTWDGFTFANGQATATGVVTFGGYAGRAAAHHITLRHITIAASCTGRATGTSSPATDHAIYFAHAVGGPHDLLLEDIAVDGSGGLASALHFFHSDSANQNAWNVTVRRLTVNRTQQAIILWDRTIHDVTVDGATIADALSFAVRYEDPGLNITLMNITSTGSGKQGFFSSLGSEPPGLALSANSLN